MAELIKHYTQRVTEFSLTGPKEDVKVDEWYRLDSIDISEQPIKYTYKFSREHVLEEVPYA